MARKSYLYICIALVLMSNALASTNVETPQKSEQKKTENLETASVSTAIKQEPKPQQQQQEEQEVVAAPAPLSDKAAKKPEETKKATEVPEEKQNENADTSQSKDEHTDDINVIEKSQHLDAGVKGDKQAESVKRVLPSEDQLDDVRFKHLGPSDETIPTGFYFFFVISVAAVFVILYRVFKLRMSRAERRYGVLGDRSNQELTPLPTSIEDVNSDEDDQTLFEVNRQQIRIF